MVSSYARKKRHKTCYRLECSGLKHSSGSISSSISSSCHFSVRLIESFQHVYSDIRLSKSFRFEGVIGSLWSTFGSVSMVQILALIPAKKVAPRAEASISTGRLTCFWVRVEMVSQMRLLFETPPSTAKLRSWIFVSFLSVSINWTRRSTLRQKVHFGGIWATVLSQYLKF